MSKFMGERQDLRDIVNDLDKFHFSRIIDYNQKILREEI